MHAPFRDAAFLLLEASFWVADHRSAELLSDVLITHRHAHVRGCCTSLLCNNDRCLQSWTAKTRSWSCPQELPSGATIGKHR